MKLIILHDIKNDEGIRLFFMDVWEHYVKVSLLPSSYTFPCLFELEI